MTDAERLARKWFVIVNDDDFHVGAPVEHRYLRAAQALLDDPCWTITYTPPDPAELITRAYVAGFAPNEGAPGYRRKFRQLLDDGIILPGPALDADA